MLTVTLNEETVELPEPSTLQDLLQRAGTPDQPYAVAVNAAFVPRGRYEETILAEGDRVELVVAAQGG